jgi:hypothetical protein
MKHRSPLLWLALVATMTCLTGCLSLLQSLAPGKNSDLAIVQITNQTHEAVVIYGQGAEVGPSATTSIFAKRGSRLTAVGKTSGANFGSFVVGDGPQEWYLH